MAPGGLELESVVKSLRIHETINYIEKRNPHNKLFFFFFFFFLSVDRQSVFLNYFVEKNMKSRLDSGCGSWTYA